MKIVVLAGGLSPERHVSITSGAMVTRALRGAGHEVALIDLFFPVAETFETLAKKEIPSSFFQVDTRIPDLQALKQEQNQDSMIGEGVIALCRQVDIAFLALHGACGEDGRLQGLLELEGIPFTGSPSLPSAIAMDKDLTKRLIMDTIPTAKWKKVSVSQDNMQDLVEKTPLPVVVKPLNSGSSIGVSIAKDKHSLRTALEESISLGGDTLLEEFISGREIQVAILGDKALPAIEILVEEGFYDMENKYLAGKAREICPADISEAVAKKLEKYSLEAFHALGLSVLARADFIVTAEGEAYFLEINTLPGMTATSLVPQEAAAVGMDYQELCETIVALSLKK